MSFIGNLTPLVALDRLTAAGWGDVRQQAIPAEVWTALRAGEALPPCPLELQCKGAQRGPKRGKANLPVELRREGMFSAMRKRQKATVLGGGG